MNRFIIGFLFFFTFSLGMNTNLCSENDMKPKGSKDSNGLAESIRVLWFVSDFKRSENAMLSENEARAMLLKPLDMDDTSITFDGTKCRHVSFQTNKVNTSEYLFHNYNITPEWLGIADDVMKVILTNCDIPGFNEYMHLEDGRLVIFVNGVFFFFRLNITY
jgi:hypothetical protein